MQCTNSHELYADQIHRHKLLLGTVPTTNKRIQKHLERFSHSKNCPNLNWVFD